MTESLGDGQWTAARHVGSLGNTLWHDNLGRARIELATVAPQIIHTQNFASALRASTFGPAGLSMTFCATMTGPLGLAFQRASALRASALRYLHTCSPTHCTRRRFFARSTAWLATVAQQINHTQNFASALRASTFGPAGLSMNTVTRRLGPSGLALPQGFGASRLGTPLYGLLRRGIARGADFSRAPRPSRRVARAPQRL